MAIKVQFPAGESNVTVRGLYQWDYGQVLEIECGEIGSEILEAHFACPNMSEAIVRTCTFSNGVGTVPIPDECLEQTSSVTVWICRRDSTQRHTIKTIVLPLTARTRPGNMLDDVPASYTDAVGQLIEEVNEAVDALENGNVTAANAKNAETAGHATTAGSATNATYATSAGSAGKLSVMYQHQVAIVLAFQNTESGTSSNDEVTFYLSITSTDSTLNALELGKKMLLSNKIGALNILGYKTSDSNIASFVPVQNYTYLGLTSGSNYFKFSYTQNGQTFYGYFDTYPEVKVTTVQVY